MGSRRDASAETRIRPGGDRSWQSRRRVGLVLLIATGLLAGCGGGSRYDGEDGVDAPSAASFPDTGGRTLEEIAAAEGLDDQIVASPAGRVFRPGENRFAFGMFTVAREQIDDAEVAVYVAHGPDGRARGPYPARIETLATAPAFTSKTSSGDPDAITQVYVTEPDLPARGEWRLLALVRDGESSFAATRMPSIEVKSFAEIPGPGDRAPLIHTPTIEDVGDITKIETRIPPDTMHEVDFADVIGRKPIVLVFATPALCSSRVCGPVVDVVEQAKSAFDDSEAAFIHMEVYRDNTVEKGIRPQLRAFGLPTEPWLFVIDREGRVSTVIEGGFSVSELEDAVRKVVE